MLSRTLIAVSVGLTLTAPMTASAEQRALLVGVGKYAVSKYDLPGIDLDRVRDTLLVMGFEESQIRTLADDQATSRNVIDGFEGWLKQGVEKDDRVVFYFSGHGSNIPDFDGDEPDGADEVLVTHDGRVTQQNGRATLTGVVSDDKIGAMIDAIPSNNIWIVVDACHSGTMTRDIVLENKSLTGEPVFEKSITYPGMPESHNSTAFTRGLSKTEDGETKFVAVSAAGDGEKAIDTSRGGVFTIGLTDSIREVAKKGTNVTINELRDAAETYITSKVDPSRIHHPQVTGSKALAGGALRIIPSAPNAGKGPNRKRLAKMVEEQGNAFPLTASKKKYLEGDKVEISMTVPAKGYLNVVSVDSEDGTTVLFPNKYEQNNLVKWGKLTIPTEVMAFDLPACAPFGSTYVAGFVTKEKINFYNTTLDRDSTGKVQAVLASLSPTATRAIRVALREDQQASAQQATAQPASEEQASAQQATTQQPATAKRKRRNYAAQLELEVLGVGRTPDICKDEDETET